MRDVQRHMPRRAATMNDLAFMAGELVLVTLPHKDPGDVPVWTRQNGDVTLTIQPGTMQDPTDSRRRVCLGYPYGSTARLLLYWMVTTARVTGTPRLELGPSLARFLRTLGLTPDDSTGKRSSASSVYRQMGRLVAAHITFERPLEENGRHGRPWLQMPVAKAGCLWWDARDTTRTPLWGSYVVLNDDFFHAILQHPVPVRMRTLLALKKSPLGLDLYAWATYESAKAQRHRHGRFVAWSLLHAQFGTELGRLDNFVTRAKREMRKIQAYCPGIQLGFARGGVQILAGSRPDVPLRAAQDPVPAPPPPPDVPSATALEYVRQHIKPTESATMLAVAFQKKVQRGEVANTDEAYIAFAESHDRQPPVQR